MLCLYSHSSDIAYYPERGVIKMSNQVNQMLGCTEESVDSLFVTAYNINMRLAGMLSDAQELMAMGKTEQATQIINQVKYYFFEYTDTRNQVSVQKVEA
jgi:hypothetical protein